MSGATFEQCEASWHSLKQTIAANLAAERGWADQLIQEQTSAAAQRTSAAQTGVADAVREGTGDEASKETIEIAREAKNAAVRDQGAIQARAEAMRAHYDPLNGMLNESITAIDAAMTLYAKGRNTVTVMTEKAARWESIRGSLAGLSGEIDARGKEPSWQAFASSEQYRMAVNPQLSAVSELAVMVATSKGAAQNVALIQEAIYTALDSSMLKTAASVAAAPVTTSGMVQLYRASVSASWALMGLKVFVEKNQYAYGSDWATPASQTASDLVRQRSALTTLGYYGQWPRITDQTAAVTAASETGVANADVHIQGRGQSETLQGFDF